MPDFLDYLLICAVAFLASGMTFFSGFGLGTLMVPVFALFFPIEIAIALTAIVHFLNNLFKLVLIGRHADKSIILRFGIPSMIAAVLGAWLLSSLAHLPAWGQYQLNDHTFFLTPVKSIIAVLMVIFALFDLVPSLKNLSFPPRFLPLGGLLSGFFGGLSGNQGALRSAFLVKTGIPKEAFIATGVVIACLIDVSRLAVYSQNILAVQEQLDVALLVAVTLSAFMGAFLGSRLLKKVTIHFLQTLVGILLLLVALGLGLGWL
ncbi:TSUP family transporter [Nibribacter ruber]|uniref:Probable membrane transporter protein n=1 Tax=Nibribacter ruber TaxID=2698458 RepID=A0A6P1NYP1_9BACT|nr:sulfite exporter TauE/SafE family protein [Nibribacter ruber]QHL87088.1 TSUP family transporter [Nibribacter ruber]